MINHKTKYIAFLILFIFAASALAQSGGYFGERHPKLKITGLYQLTSWSPTTHSLETNTTYSWDTFDYEMKTWSHDFKEENVGNLMGGKVEVEMSDWFIGMKLLRGSTTFEDEFTNRQWENVLRSTGSTEIVSEDDIITDENEYSFIEIEYTAGVKFSGITAFVGILDFHQHMQEISYDNSHYYDDELSFIGYGGGVGYGHQFQQKITVSGEGAYYLNPSFEEPIEGNWSHEKYKGATSLSGELEYLVSDNVVAVIGYEYRKMMGADSGEEVTFSELGKTGDFTRKEFDINTDLASHRITFGIGVVFGLR